MKDAFNIVPRHYDDDGMPIWKSMLSPTSNTQRALVLAPPNKVIPILFVPGIMGSNLKVINTKQTKGETIAWRPDFAGLKDIRRDAADRQNLLNPANTEVDTAVTSKGQTKVDPLAGMSLAAAEKRGWGSVMWGSYGDILQYLELNANSACFWEPALKKVVVSAIWQPLIDKGVVTVNTGAHKLQQPELEHLSEYWFPVHAIGYNWLQSNEDSGIYLAKQIEQIKTFYQKKFKDVAACQKVILVTHSMGGLVARAAVHPEMGKAKDSVLGIVHGVMPAIGAASTYKRMRTGFGSFSILSTEGQTNGVLGSNGKEVTAVLGHSPGGLQLLPNKNYASDGWLKVEGITEKPYVIASNGNPYANIYSEKNKWWRMVHPDWLDPAKRFTVDPKKTAWDSYIAALLNAEKFHDKLTGQYHDQSYVFFGSDKKQLAYGDVVWKKVSWMDENVGDLRRSQNTKESLMKDGMSHQQWDNSEGRTAAILGSAHASFDMTAPRDPGDGTVPAISGTAPEHASPANIKFQCAISGIDHQSSYATVNTAVINFVLYSACKMVQELKS